METPCRTPWCLDKLIVGAVFSSSIRGVLVPTKERSFFSATNGPAVSELAYLVIREGSKWTDVFRLVPGESVTIGRAPTNQIVLKDDRCSRGHAELFMSEGHWTLRDLDSRNGTVVGEQLVKGDWLLRPGDVVRIGRSQLVFVHNLSEAFSEGGTVVYSAAPNLPAAVLRAFARKAGVHIYLDTDEPVYGNRSYLGFTVYQAGKRTLRLPRRTPVYDLYEQRFLSEDAEEIVLELPAKTTRLLLLGKP